VDWKLMGEKKSRAGNARDTTTMSRIEKQAGIRRNMVEKIPEGRSTKKSQP